MSAVLRVSAVIGFCLVASAAACQKRSPGAGPEMAAPRQQKQVKEPPPPVDEFAGQPDPILSISRPLFTVPARALCLLRVPSAEHSRARLTEAGMSAWLQGREVLDALSMLLQHAAEDGRSSPVDAELVARLLRVAFSWSGEFSLALVPESSHSRRLEVLAAAVLGAEEANRPAVTMLQDLPVVHVRTDQLLLVSTSDALLGEAQARAPRGRGSILASGPFALAWQSVASPDDVAQVFVNLTQLWDWMPQEFGDMARRLRLSSYESLLYSMQLDADGGRCHEAVCVGARDRNHPLRELLGAGSFTGAVLSALPGDAQNVSVLSGDPGDLLGRVKSLLPGERQSALDEQIAAMSQLWKVDVASELDACVGSELAFAKVPVTAAADASLVAVSVRDQARLQKLFDRVWLDKSTAVTRSENYKNHRLCWFDRDALKALRVTAPDLLPVLVLLPGRLLGAESVEGMKKALDGVHASPLAARDDVAAALKDAGGRISVFSYVAAAPPGLAFVRLDDLSVSIQSSGAPAGFKPLRDSPPCQGLAATMLPEIANLRIAANEQSAVDKLRRIHAAEREFAAAALLDRDQDRIGEYAFLGELIGAVALRDGAKGATPPLNGVMEYLDGGYAVASGYCFELFLPGPRGVPVSGSEAASADVDADLAERVYRVYAWPLRFGELGKHTFVMDSNGEIYATDGEEGAASYSGADLRPRGDAFGEREATLLSPGSGPVRQGRDGRLWVARW